MSELEQIVARTRVAVERRRATVPLSELHAQAGDVEPRRGFVDALAAPGLSLIAEHKRRSPSAGVIRGDLALEEVVTAYERAGARALSVLTEEEGFGGCLDDLELARRASSLPILRKDFIVDEYQVVESLVAGADAILLIVAALPIVALRSLHDRAAQLGLATVVEVHDESELESAMSVDAPVIGINNRDLTTLRVDPERIHALLAQAPPDRLIVAESGFRARAQLERLAAAGVDAVLIGEALMRASDIEAACRELSGVTELESPGRGGTG